MNAEKNTEFNYLLNAMERAGQEAHPAKAGYAGKRKALLAHVRELERKASAFDALPKDEAIAQIDVAAVWVQKAANALEAARSALTAPGVSVGATTCGTCHGSGVVPDGEIPSAFGNEPIKCVKDCPACKGGSRGAGGLEK